MSHSKEQALLPLLDLLYSCVDDESAWSTFLTSLGEYLGASVVGISTTASLQAVVGVDPGELLKYQKHYLSINPWLSEPRSYPEGQVLLTDEVLPVNTYRKTSFYNEWGKKNLVVHAVGGALKVGSNSFLFLSINRGDSQHPFGEKERSVVQMLMPHIQRAAHLHERLRTLEQRTWLLDALTYPLLYVTSDRTVRWANDAAETLLRSGDGLYLRDSKLHAKLQSEDVALHKLLSERRTSPLDDAAGYGGWLRVTQADTGSEISLFLARSPHTLRKIIGVNQEGSGFLIFIASQSIDGNLLAARLRRTWGLTPAEAALAVELLESESLQAAATKLCVSRNTAKTQLAAIFQKAGTHRQTELIRKLLTVAVIAPVRPEHRV